MNLYLISQSENNGYDTYDSAIVCAENPEDARNTHPCDYCWINDAWEDLNGYRTRSQRDWTTPESVEVRFIGITDKNIGPGVVLASYNAG